jgi:hypothetical protein
MQLHIRLWQYPAKVIVAEQHLRATVATSLKRDLHFAEDKHNCTVCVEGIDGHEQAVIK